MIEFYTCNKRLDRIEFNEKNVLDAIKKKKKLWFDVIKPEKHEFMLLEKIFGLHQVTTQDCFTNNTRVKVEVFENNYLFSALYGIRWDHDIRFVEIDVVLGNNFLITCKTTKSKRLVDLGNNIEVIESLMKKGVDILFHHIIDMEIDNYFPVIDKLDEEAEKLDRQCFKDPTKDVLARLDNMKDKISHMKRTVFNQKDKLILLTKKETPFISRDARMYFRDVHDNSVRIADLVDGLKEELSGTLNTYMSLVSNKMNDIMRMLTIIATIMMPLTVVGSIYGMNFKYMPELQWKYGYFAVLGFMALLSALMLFYFKKKKWI